jgi:hypothetical protein
LIKVLQHSRQFKPGDPIKLISPVDQLPLQKAERSKFLPTEYDFWTEDYSRNNWDFGHIFKFSFSFYDHLQRVERIKASYLENFRYIINQ